MSNKILLIEDYPETVGMIKSIFKTRGYEITVAYEGITGLQKAISEKPDLILLDIMMPGMSGIEVCKKLKSDPETSKIPIIIISVKTENEDLQLGKEVGADGYVTKPFYPDELVEVVEKYLQS